MTEADHESEEVDVEPFEGYPAFPEAQAEDDQQDDLSIIEGESLGDDLSQPKHLGAPDA